jgi:hypothetical protein
MKKFALLILIILVWFLLHQSVKAEWSGRVAPNEPTQSSLSLPSPWNYKNFIITPKARYHIKAVVLSKHSYWGGETEDKLAPYDLALGWGAMSEANVINQLKISQGWRWYEYNWSKMPPINPSEIITHSANNHIIPSEDNVLTAIKRIKQYDLVELNGYLVNVASRDGNWHWNSSLTRSDTAGGSCELFWVTRVSN